ncbi:MAG: transposase [Nitrososphaerota archaeon]|nr:transposase [Nitrososphaerota archaeon]
MSQKEVAKVVGATQSGVSRWWTKYKSEGDFDALNSTRHTGRPFLLKDEQKRGLVEVLLKGAESYGFETDIWTTERVSRVIYEKFGVKYHPDHVRRILHSLGLSWKRVESVAREMDEGAIRKWTSDTLPHIKKAD